jgi:hypothetical protein
MRRLVVSLVVQLVMVGLATPASSLPDGPDGDVDGVGWFSVEVAESNSLGNPPPEPMDTYESLRFDLSAGWDFGDRYGYTCAWAEFFQGTDERFEVHFENRLDYELDVQINDRHGTEDENIPSGTINSLCGEGVTNPSIAKGGIPTHDRTDHFPHMIHPGEGVAFYDDGAPLTFLSLQHAECDKAYWVPGDDAGEAWLWWDEDGPSEQMPGHPLNCGGGPIEPVPVVRLIVQNADPDIGYCTTDEMDGSRCSGPTPTHPSTVSVRLGRNLMASGRVGVPDATAACVQDRTVLLQRRVQGHQGHWKNSGRDSTNSDGRYSVHVRPRKGRYRAWVLQQELIDGSTCLAATSRGVSLRL